ncbi:MAG TPA: phosphoribosylanthranilate isomerase [Chthoniobacterales bacterium]|jgi:phosphoribosylanthranilate isomerase
MAVRIFVKICGITNRLDAENAISAGADALGFNFWPGSRRYIDPRQASDWIRDLPGSVVHVGVVVNPSIMQACTMAQAVNVLQLHGSETPSFCKELSAVSVRFWKAIPALKSELADNFGAERIVLDTATEAGFGGTGLTFSWRWARHFIATHSTEKVILAGGLNPENVAQAIERTGPYGVDVSSGVEAAVGRKDAHKVRDFIAAARAAQCIG